MQRAKLGQGYVYHGVASSLYLTKVCKHLGTKEFSCWTFRREMLSYSSPI